MNDIAAAVNRVEKFTRFSPDYTNATQIWEADEGDIADVTRRLISAANSACSENIPIENYEKALSEIEELEPFVVEKLEVDYPTWRDLEKYLNAIRDLVHLRVTAN
jgi:hypothetical protein